MAKFGNKSKASGPDPKKVFEFRYKVVELSSLQASHDEALAVNPNFPKELQPRIRSREASRQQVLEIAKNLQADALIDDLKTLDRGPMIVGADNVVESGNGRTIALKIARLEFPEQWAAYEAQVRARAAEFGIESTQGIKDPVLVRERITEVDRQEFTAMANQSATLTMSPIEQALQDSKRITGASLAGLQVGDTQTIDQALKSQNNKAVVSTFLKDLPKNEQAALVDSSGALNQVGIQRIKAAIFAKVFTGDAGQRLTTTFFESVDPIVKQVENALFDALPALAKSEGLATTGQRNADLSIGEDIAKVIDVLARLKQEGIAVSDYLAQNSLFEKELDPEQEKLLAFFDEQGRSRKRMREFVKSYAEAVEASPHPAQASMFADAQESKSEILDRLIEDQRKESSAAGVGLFALIEQREKTEGFSRGSAPEAPTIAPTPQISTRLEERRGPTATRIEREQRRIKEQAAAVELARTKADSDEAKAKQERERIDAKKEKLIPKIIAERQRIEQQLQDLQFQMSQDAIARKRPSVSDAQIQVKARQLKALDDQLDELGVPKRHRTDRRTASQIATGGTRVTPQIIGDKVIRGGVVKDTGIRARVDDILERPRGITDSFDIPLEKTKLLVDEKLLVKKSFTSGPIMGFWEDGKFVVTDGNHRVAEAKRRGAKTIKGVLDPGFVTKGSPLTLKEAIKETETKPSPPPASVGISQQQAQRHFNKITLERAIDTRKTSETVAPAVAKTEADAELQRKWKANPGRLDFEGVDTHKPRKAKNRNPPAKRRKAPPKAPPRRTQTSVSTTR